MLQHGLVSINARDRWGGTALADAVREGHSQIAELLRSRGGELMYDEVKASGELCELARAGDVKSVKMLLDGGCAVNSADYDKRTCLHVAASFGNRNVVEALLEHGVDINTKDRWGGTALADAVRERHTQIAELLRSRGGRIGMVN